ncbi:MAG: hypothetical protein JXA73_13085 [Acidobacteria bacterium]|nr:hypothetical protein [Acidobacteriota bacterium]
MKQPIMGTAVETVFDLFSRRKIWIFLLICAVALLAVVYLRYALLAPVDHDEVEHAHVGFRTLNGQLPYRDFYQNHWPAYWILSRQFLRAFPFSTHALLAGRIASLLALMGCWLLGLRLLGSFRGGRTRLGLALYTCALIILACKMEFHEARPDPIMVLIATAGLCFIPMRGNISFARALILGVLFGLSASVSTKMLPMAGIVPALIFLHCIRDRRLRPAAGLLPYGLGVLLGLLPTAVWIFRCELYDFFLLDVIGINSAVSKPWFLSFAFLRIPIYLSSVLGIVALFEIYKRRSNRDANGPLILALTILAGIGLAFLARHAARYNLQILIVPLSVGFAGLLIHLCMRIQVRSYQLLLCAALIGYPVFDLTSTLTNLRKNPGSLAWHDLQMMMELAKPGNRTCSAFSPSHPVFCHDVSGLSNGWDLLFAQQIREKRQAERFRRLWHDGIRKTIDLRPDIILRRDPESIWERAVESRLITPDELNALDALRPLYEVRQIGGREVWIRIGR